MDVVEQCGAAIARPSQTLYLGRDRGPGKHWTRDADPPLQKWHSEGSLPSAGFPPQQAG